MELSFTTGGFHYGWRPARKFDFKYFLKLANHGELEAALGRMVTLVCKLIIHQSTASYSPWLILKKMNRHRKVLVSSSFNDIIV
jgi:hypothetical protein